MTLSTGHAAAHHRRSVIVAPRTSEIVEQTTLPRDPGPNEVLLRVTRNGICASELPVWLNGPDAEPVTIGHEPVATVVAVGPGVDNVDEGDVVTGRIGNSLADLVLAPTIDLVRVPDGVTGDAAIGEPLGCIVEAIRRTPLDIGDRVAIVGLGFMGMCLLDIVNIGGVSEIVAIDPRPDARQTALERGAVAALAPDGLANGAMDDAFDVVFEVSGSQPGLDLATALSTEHGTLSLVGYHQGARTVDVHAWNWKALEVVNGHVRDRRRLAESTARGLALVASNQIPYAELFTHHYPLEGIDDAYTDLQGKPEGFVKAVVVLDSDSESSTFPHPNGAKDGVS